MSAPVPILNVSDLEAMPTTALLKRWRALLSCEPSYVMSDRVGYEPEADPKDSGMIEYSECSEWRDAYADVKKILETREHIPRGPEKKAKGLARTAKRKLGERRSGRQGKGRR